MLLNRKNRKAQQSKYRSLFKKHLPAPVLFSDSKAGAPIQFLQHTIQENMSESILVCMANTALLS